MAGHRAAVAERKVDVLVSVNVNDPRPISFRGEDRVAASPKHHPRHRNAADERTLRPLVELARALVVGSKAFELAR